MILTEPLDFIKMKKIIGTIKHKWAEYLLRLLSLWLAFGSFRLNNWSEGQKEKKGGYSTWNRVYKAQIKNAQLILTVITEDTTFINLEELHFALLQTGWAWFGQN